MIELAILMNPEVMVEYGCKSFLEMFITKVSIKGDLYELDGLELDGLQLVATSSKKRAMMPF